MYRLKQTLNDLIDYVYPDDERRRTYKAFFIEVTNKDLKSKNGEYNKKNQLIRLFNTNRRNENKLVVTAIHEVAHHINSMQGNTDIHGPGFYKNYERLLHGALDMRLFTKSEWFSAYEEIRDSQSENKVQQMLLRYRPKETGYKAGLKKITVYDGYELKEQLKEMGFSFNKIVKGWELEIEESEPITEWLEERGARFAVSEASKPFVKKEEDNKPYCLVVLNGYDVKDALRDAGYSYCSADRSWRLRFNGETANACKKTLMAICENLDVEWSKQHADIIVTIKKKGRTYGKRVID